jgi:hypothetical protein
MRGTDCGEEAREVPGVQFGETGLPEPSFLKARFIQVLPEKRLFDRLPRALYASQFQEIVTLNSARV